MSHWLDKKLLIPANRNENGFYQWDAKERAEQN